MTPVDEAYDHPFGGSVARRGRYEYRLAQDCILPLLARWGVDAGERVLDFGCCSKGPALTRAAG